MDTSNFPEKIHTANAYAVIVGIGKYKDPSIPVLKYTHADADAMYQVLTDPKKIGIPKENVRLLIDQDAVMQNIRSVIGTWLWKKASEDSTVIIFFSGHGGVESDPSGAYLKYLLPWDTRRDDLYASAISSRDFEGLLQRIVSHRLVMFLDACHAGGVITREGARDVATIENFCSDLSSGAGRAVIAAAQGNQQSWEDDTLAHGVFAYHLLEGLKGKADADEDGRVSLTELFNYLTLKVPRTAKELTGAIQEPMMCSSLTRDIVLTVDIEKLEKIKREKELAEQAARLQEDKNRLFQLHFDRKLSTRLYDRVLKVYDAEKASLNEADKKIYEDTIDYLNGNLTLVNYVFSLEHTIEKTAEKDVKVAPPPKPPEPVKDTVKDIPERSADKLPKPAEPVKKSVKDTSSVSASQHPTEFRPKIMDDQKKGFPLKPVLISLSSIVVIAIIVLTIRALMNNQGPIDTTPTYGIVNTSTANIKPPGSPTSTTTSTKTVAPLYSYHAFTTFGLFFDSVNNDSPWQNQLVRQAVDYVISRPTIAGYALGAQTALWQVVPEQEPDYVDSISNRAYSVAKAKELMAEAGYPYGFETTLYVDTWYSFNYPNVIGEIRNNLEKIGIITHLVTYDYNTVFIHSCIVLRSMNFSASRIETIKFYFCGDGNFMQQTEWPSDIASLMSGIESKDETAQRNIYRQVNAKIYANTTYISLYSTDTLPNSME
jgi:uncharacterized caspase-like protein